MSNFENLQSQSFFWVRTSAINLVVRNFAELWTTIADAHQWFFTATWVIKYQIIQKGIINL
jgi:hypothetical protein